DRHHRSRRLHPGCRAGGRYLSRHPRRRRPPHRGRGPPAAAAHGVGGFRRPGLRGRAHFQAAAGGGGRLGAIARAAVPDPGHPRRRWAAGGAGVAFLAPLPGRGGRAGALRLHGGGAQPPRGPQRAAAVAAQPARLRAGRGGGGGAARGRRDRAARVGRNHPRPVGGRRGRAGQPDSPRRRHPGRGAGLPPDRHGRRLRARAAAPQRGAGAIPAERPFRATAVERSGRLRHGGAAARLRLCLDRPHGRRALHAGAAGRAVRARAAPALGRPPGRRAADRAALVVPALGHGRVALDGHAPCAGGRRGARRASDRRAGPQPRLPRRRGPRRRRDRGVEPRRRSGGARRAGALPGEAAPRHAADALGHARPGTAVRQRLRAGARRAAARHRGGGPCPGAEAGLRAAGHGPRAGGDGVAGGAGAAPVRV
ncbi:MAG: hypothetical protein AVDCRST_MAG04-1179, partial [uncultured Acetobacteraceae bacterium]